MEKALLKREMVRITKEHEDAHRLEIFEPKTVVVLPNGKAIAYSNIGDRYTKAERRAINEAIDKEIEAKLPEHLKRGGM